MTNGSHVCFSSITLGRIMLCQNLLVHADIPDRLGERIDAYAKMLAARRAQWYVELVVHEAESAES